MKTEPVQLRGGMALLILSVRQHWTEVRISFMREPLNRDVIREADWGSSSRTDITVSL